MFNKHAYSIGWQTCLLMLFFFGCNSKDNHAIVVDRNDALRDKLALLDAHLHIFSAEKKIHSGDLITRTGNDFTSESLRMLNRRDRTYSHCGIASVEHDSVFVYHAIGGEFNPDQKLRRDAFSDFASPVFNRGIGIYRYALPDTTVHAVIQVAQDLFHSNMMFDMNFDLATDSRMYCAEFVYKVFIKAAGRAVQFNLSHIKGFEFIGVDDLFLEPHCRMLEEILYK